MAVVHGAELLEIITDAGESAKSLDRTGIKRLFSLIDAGQVDAIIIAKLDRLTRSVKDLADMLEKFNRRGVALISVAESLDTGSAAGRLVLNIMTAVSQWEREAIGERTRDALRHKKNQGERVGTVPYGYRIASDGKRLEINMAEQAIVSRVQSLRLEAKTTRQIADMLNAEAYTTRKGGQFKFQYVAELAKLPVAA